jgi:hypothetical protein
MMKRSSSKIAILVVTVLSVGVGAQTGGTMAREHMAGKMDMKAAAYTGCIEAGSAPGTFTLTHVVEDHMGKGMMKDSKDKPAMSGEHMEHDAMVPTMLSLTGTGVDLRKHLGHKVTVTGSLSEGSTSAMEKDTMKAAPSTFSVTSLKLIAASCS